MSILELRTDKERLLFKISLVVSIIFWAVLVLGTLGAGILYIAMGAGFVLLTKALFLAYIKGNGVKITPEQFPDLHARLEKAAEKLQMKTVPEAYLLNERGLFNAFATTFLGRNFVVLYAELLEACDEDDGSIDFIIGHELGHVALEHLKYTPVLLPSRMVPLLGAAYSRYCEYSCDRAGTVAAQNADGAVHGLAVLAAGAKYAKRLNVDEYLNQRLETGHFWMSVVELQMSHPYLPKRMGAIIGDTKPEMAVPEVARNPLAYLAAPFLGAGAGGGGAIAAVAVVGIVVAIAIPAAIGQRAKSEDAFKQALQEQAEIQAKFDKEQEDETDIIRPTEEVEKTVKPVTIGIQDDEPAVRRRAPKRAVKKSSRKRRVRSTKRKPMKAKKRRTVERRRKQKRPAPPPAAKADDDDGFADDY